MEKRRENTEKNAGKIFQKKGNPRGKSILPLYIVDMLQKAKLENKPVTITQLQKMILEEKGIFFERKGIEFAITNMHQFCSYVTIKHVKVHAVRNHANAFSLVINNLQSDVRQA